MVLVLMEQVPKEEPDLLIMLAIIVMFVVSILIALSFAGRCPFTPC